MKIFRWFTDKAESFLKKRGHEGSFRTLVEDWRWILAYGRPYRWQIVAYTWLGIFSSAMGLAGGVAGKFTIDIITGHDSSRLWFVIAVMVLSTALSILFSSLCSRLLASMTVDLRNDMQEDLFRRLMQAEWLSLSRYSSGELASRFSSDVGAVAGNAIVWLPNLVTHGFTFVATLAVILYYDATMALIAFISVPFLMGSARFLMKKMRDFSQKTREADSDLMAYQVECFNNLDTLKSFAVEGRAVEKLLGRQQRSRSVTMDYNAFSIRMRIGMSVLGTVVQLTAFGYCLWRLWSGAITFGTMTLFLQQRSSLSAAFSSVISLIPTALNGAVSARRLREIQELPAEAKIAGTVATEGGCTVSVKAASVAYDTEVPVVREATFKAAPQEIVALVGPSGEGKTTMIRLILGLLHPKEGEAVLIDRSGAAMPLSADTRRSFSYVPQGNTLMSGSIADNLRLVREDASDAALEAALKTACAWEFVSALPQGMETVIGEHGRGLSEGQAQRIAIARAVLRDAPVLLMDEATSALDVATERRVLRNILEHCPEKTCIVTTHRPSVLSLCKRVYRVQEGRLEELSSEESARLAMDY